LAASVAIALSFFVIIRWQAPLLVTLFIPDHPETILITLKAARVISWSLLLMPIGIIGSTFFTALEKAGQSLLIALSRGLVFTVIGLLLFPAIWGETGIWITPLFSEAVSVLVTLYLFYRWAYHLPEAAISKVACEPLPSLEQ
jgi:Na+-driven multidrug efflux pump